jgi:hypothetical protein
MKLLSNILLLLFSLNLFSCRTGESDKPEAISGLEMINVPNKIENALQFDSIFSNVQTVPLETDDNCLIGRVTKVLFHNDKMIILDERMNLYVFDIKGNFLNPIGKEGRGPGEYLELRDFDMDEFGNIYILSYKEILKFSIEGDYIKRISFNFEESGIHCNPLEFGVLNETRFYVWGGSVGVKENTEWKLYAMYEINDTGKIINSYFPLRYPTTQSFEKHRFTRYKKSFLVEPNFGINSIYALHNQELTEVYKIDFGSKNISSPVPDGFTSIAEFKKKVDQVSYHSIESFIETDDWVYFRFLHKMKRYNVYYSKHLEKAFVSRFNLTTLPQIITGRLENQFISFCDPQSMIKYINESTTKGILRNNISADLKNLNPTDNPILLICTLRQY